MPRTLDPELRSALAARIRYYNEMGIYDFYRRRFGTRGEVASSPVAVDEGNCGFDKSRIGEEMSHGRPRLPRRARCEDNIFE